ncbi:hypothetical protein [Anaerosporobacter sp.]|uniref:hypothetical protein n=1 Tax=Anaerosporobacter sp. TaxID=1872529 RepID=UPI00286F171D|nr:hypothetical protein [Anaerosporobacter sp.]
MKKEDGYLDFVQDNAKKLGKIFMLDTGEGNDLEYEKKGWYVEELSGWLINENEKSLFLKSIENDTVEDVFPNDFVWVKWRLVEDELQVWFEQVVPF